MVKYEIVKRVIDEYVMEYHSEEPDIPPEELIDRVRAARQKPDLRRRRVEFEVKRCS